MHSLKVTAKADSDFVDAWLYTAATWGVDQADKYLDQLEMGLSHLLDNPLLGVDYSHILAGYRKLRIKHHDIFYRVDAAGILVVRVLHEDMDAPQRLMD
ncbi:type II toxin-antitoxin system RelE/ParE family toxin [Pseudomonas sp. MS19]|uniref:type II toxin-antitoxin system RelE/ParE family toxin n=1 Tax=Pseudomonas sp. MS19 TaxID=2579939 RepID=UPI001561D72C|nr:type II toxin-antitoxin system RelE/ParE family toxin [Pseudomonas sp. MS19]NRH26389.1 type II toxin-antitoxin system RelE/ParE family toxin [Pseudomonas sp. MS19]